MPNLKFSRESPYQKIEVREDRVDGRRIRRLYLDGVEHSAIDHDRPERPVWIYTDFVHLAWLFAESPRRALIAGLGGGVIPMSLRRGRPDLRIDVVEIDPDVVAVAGKYFRAQEDSRMRIFVDDAARFMQKSERVYDVVIMDVYRSKNDDLWLPPALSSMKFYRTVDRRLSRDGVVVLNLIGRLKGKSRKTLSVIRKLERIFPQIYLFPIFLKKAPNLEEERNILVVCSRERKRLSPAAIFRRARRLASGGKTFFRDLPLHAENLYVPPVRKRGSVPFKG